MPTPPLIVEATIHFLQAHLPFSRMVRRDLEFIASRARLGYFPVGSVYVPVHCILPLSPAPDAVPVMPSKRHLPPLNVPVALAASVFSSWRAL